MCDQLKQYQVLDVEEAGASYKVRHKVTNEIVRWKAYDCSEYADETLRQVSEEARAVGEWLRGHGRSRGEAALRPLDTVLAARPAAGQAAGTRVLYLVVEACAGRRLCAHAAGTPAAAATPPSEPLLWRALHATASLAKLLHQFPLRHLATSITDSSIFVAENGSIKIDCFQMATAGQAQHNIVQQLGIAFHKLLCDIAQSMDGSPHYSQDLKDLVELIVDKNIQADSVLLHPTVLANLELASMDIATNLGSRSETKLLDTQDTGSTYPVQKIISRSRSPLYGNETLDLNEPFSPVQSISPTVAALALELPGFVPSTGRATNLCKPQQITHQILSEEWMSRMLALRQREETLNKRERDLFTKEIIISNTPDIPIQTKDDQLESYHDNEVNGITLPKVMCQKKTSNINLKHRRADSVKRRQLRPRTFNHSELDSSLSADQGDDSVVVTSTKFTKDNLPPYIFPLLDPKRVHFSSNPFTESDESVTLTYYELENFESSGNQAKGKEDKFYNLPEKDISVFKYMEGCAAKQELPSPNKQGRLSCLKKVLSDVTNIEQHESRILRASSRRTLSSRTSDKSVSTDNSISSCLQSQAPTKMSRASQQQMCSSLRKARLSLAQGVQVQALSPLSNSSLVGSVPQVKKPRSRMSLLSFKVKSTKNIKNSAL